MTIIDQAPTRPEAFMPTRELEDATDSLVNVLYFNAPSIEAFEAVTVTYINAFQKAYETTRKKQIVDWAGVVVSQFDAISANSGDCGYFPAIGIEDARAILKLYVEDEKAAEIRQLTSERTSTMPYALTMLLFDQIDAVRSV